MPGPLPDPNAIRRNAPTIPTTDLPASGRKAPVPEPPEWVALRRSGRAWWDWVWTMPQACGWSDGNLVTVAHRATLEDDLAALEDIDGLDFLDILDAESKKDAREAVQRVAAMATGRIQILREMRDLDDRLGLTPKGMAALRWKVVDDTPADSAPKDAAVASLADRRARLTSAS